MDMVRTLRSTLPAVVLCLVLPAVALALSEESVQTFPLTADGRISLENVNGDVTIEAWDRDEVSVETIKQGRTQKGLDRVVVEIDARDDRIDISTRYPEGGSYRGNDHARVDFMLRVPRGARLDEISLVNGSLELEGVEGDVHASLVNGRVAARGLRGDAELSTVNGSVEVELSELDPSRTVELSSVNGMVEVTVPGYVGADVEASTVHGRIENDFGIEVERGKYVGSNMRGALGGGGARVKLSSVNGSVSLRSGG